MVTSNLYFDNRRKNEKSHSLRINISKDRKTASFPLGIQLTEEQWDKENEKVINHSEAKFWNNFISRRKVEIETLILKLEDDPTIGLSQMTAKDVRDFLVLKICPEKANNSVTTKSKKEENTFLIWYDRATERKKNRTKDIFLATRRRLVEWIGEEKLSKVKFEDIKISWLEDFNDFLLNRNNSINSISIHLRNIRTIINYAIDNEVTTNYPFRRFKIKSEPTRKRNFDITTLRRIFNHQCEEEWQVKYLDFFKLTFMLIGINVIDLCYLERINQGRIEYLRSKTHRPYSIKVEKEAKAIIEKYAGEKYLVNFIDKYENYRHFYNNLCKGLKAIKEQLKIDELTTYWARHSWATIAHRIGISKDIIAQALGHGSHTVTDIYIEVDPKQVDEANRKVLDYVLYGDNNKPKRGRPPKLIKL
ncbi:MAG: site-specific integrase [Paramuribaculum sp.]|nr:site-specific integrase [Paramuribaculum sp.]